VTVRFRRRLTVCVLALLVVVALAAAVIR